MKDASQEYLRGILFLYDRNGYFLYSIVMKDV